MHHSRGLARHLFIFILMSTGHFGHYARADVVREAWASTAQAASYLRGVRCEAVDEAKAVRALGGECPPDSHNSTTKDLARVTGKLN